MPVLERLLPSAPAEPPLLLERGDLFFTRRVPLVPEEAPGPQLALAIESLAPFPPDQLYHGYVAAKNGDSALVFAAFRRRFSTDQTSAWDAAALVTPDFLPLLAARQNDSAEALVWTHAGRITALAWASGQPLPSALLCREGPPEQAPSLLASVLARAGLPDTTPARSLDGESALVRASDGSLTARIGDQILGSLPGDWSETADIRDPDFLAERRRSARRDVWLWRSLLAAAAAFALALSLEIAASAFGLAGRRAEARIADQADDVRSIETAQSLANRIAELSERRLMPFEMLNLINPARPESVVFQRALTRGLLKLEVEAQTGSADDVGAYTKALKTTPGIATAAARDIRTREGQTTFMLDIEFKADALRHEARAEDESSAPPLPAAEPVAPGPETTLLEAAS